MSIDDDRGVALVATMMAMTLLATLASALILSTMTEATIVVSYRESAETFYAAEAAMEYVVSELRASADWHDIIAGEAASEFVDGAPEGIRSVGAATIDLDRATADVNALRPSGAALYELYAYGPIAELVSQSDRDRPAYLIVWVADRSAAGATESALALLAQAYGPAGSRRTIEATVARAGGTGGAGPDPVRFAAWSEIR